jgi:hypothetical protein
LNYGDAIPIALIVATPTPPWCESAGIVDALWQRKLVRRRRNSDASGGFRDRGFVHKRPSPAQFVLQTGCDRYYEHLILLDGYHRAAAFWKFAPADSLIQAYRPLRM